MAIELLLEQTNDSGPLVPARLTAIFNLIAKLPGALRAPRAAMRGHEIHFAETLDLEDAASPSFLLEFVGQGLRVRGSAHGPSAALLAWAFHAFAASSKCTLHDVDDEADLAPEPEALREAANAYLEAYEADVREARRWRGPARNASDGGDQTGVNLLRWLAREEHLALSTDDAEVETLAGALPLTDGSALYEMLLESDAVEDVFVSESELRSLLARFTARTRTTA